MPTVIFGAIKIDGSSTGVGQRDNTNVFMGAVPNNFLIAAKCLSGMASASQEGEGWAWSYCNVENYNALSLIERIESPACKPTITPCSLMFALLGSAAGLPNVTAPRPGSRIGIFSLGVDSFRYEATLDGSEATRADVYQKLVDVLVTAGYTASVETIVDGANYSLLKLDAGDELGDKDLFLAYYLPNTLDYSYGIHAQKLSGEDTTLITDDCYFGQKEGDDDNWCFPQVIGFFNHT